MISLWSDSCNYHRGAREKRQKQMFGSESVKHCFKIKSNHVSWSFMSKNVNRSGWITRRDHTRLTLNGPPFPSSSSRMYPSTAMVDSGGCFHDNVALLFCVQHSSSWSIGAAGTVGRKNQARLQPAETWQHGRMCTESAFITQILKLQIHNALIKGSDRDLSDFQKCSQRFNIKPQHKGRNRAARIKGLALDPALSPFIWTKSSWWMVCRRGPLSRVRSKSLVILGVRVPFPHWPSVMCTLRIKASEIWKHQWSKCYLDINSTCRCYSFVICNIYWCFLFNLEPKNLSPH